MSGGNVDELLFCAKVVLEEEVMAGRLHPEHPADCGCALSRLLASVQSFEPGYCLTPTPTAGKGE
jgi:hypothetical protein